MGIQMRGLPYTSLFISVVTKPRIEVLLYLEKDMRSEKVLKL